MQTKMTTEQVKELIRKELPGIIEEDPEFHRRILDIIREADLEWEERKKKGLTKF